ncbi:hypothetical protein JQC92_05180 [Shewanella sp. 202IG2-18]|uniref:hypothetical protein n=1 Tax=Parashewanella hymeniacidonis TaxID=2807618 RepID=UPI0019606F65|nr:hypothetical protein [Parashewanella hymeniacidonis]MBM7071433.1 hypothetical protein [Parashewanella hymeniacidonis]
MTFKRILQTTISGLLLMSQCGFVQAGNTNEKTDSNVESVKTLTKSTNQGNAGAQYNLGVADGFGYGDSSGCPVDRVIENQDLSGHEGFCADIRLFSGTNLVYDSAAKDSQMTLSGGTNYIYGSAAKEAQITVSRGWNYIHDSAAKDAQITLSGGVDGGVNLLYGSAAKGAHIMTLPGSITLLAGSAANEAQMTLSGGWVKVFESAAKDAQITLSGGVNLLYGSAAENADIAVNNGRDNNFIGAHVANNAVITVCGNSTINYGTDLTDGGEVINPTELTETNAKSLMPQIKAFNDLRNSVKPLNKRCLPLATPNNFSEH